MSTSRFNRRSLALVALSLGASACGIDAPEFRFGEDLSGLQFEVFSNNVGVHPSMDVLLDPNNPFVNAVPSTEQSFELLTESSPVASFYAFATRLATIEPIGQNQFYAAQGLEVIYLARLVPDEELDRVRDLAIAAYEALLFYFPDSFQFTTAEAIDSFRLATPAYQAIVRLGGTPPPGWTLVTTSSGVEAVK